MRSGGISLAGFEMRNNERNEGGNKEMQNFSYVIKDEVGIHARPAGLLVKEA